MTFSIATQSLTHHATMTMLAAAIAKAEEIGQPQCIVIVDASGEVLGEVRMTGAKFLSRKSAQTKARTAASIRGATETVPEGFRQAIGMATGNSITGIPGGRPILLGGECVGAIGVGSGTGEQDVEVAMAALQAIGADV